MGVGDGTSVAVGSDVGVDGMGEGVSVDGMGIEAGTHPFVKTAKKTTARNIDKVGIFMILSPLYSIG
jgi:hypothetical protein